MSDERQEEAPGQRSEGDRLPVPIAPLEPAATGELLPAARAAGEIDLRRLPVEESPYAPRFRFAMGALVGVALGALVATLLLIFGPTHQTVPGPAWSSWKPDKSGSDGAQEIAAHVAPQYQLSSGVPLVAVTGGPLKVADLPVRIALSEAGKASIVNGNGILYNLCGLGPRCAIATGKPSVERFLLLQREAFELALYTFRYDSSIENVVALMPPRLGTKPENALFFRRDEPTIRSALSVPLRQTLPLPTPSVASLTDRCTLVHSIERLTKGSLFKFSFQQGQDASAFLVLQPFVAAVPTTPAQSRKLLPRCELRRLRTPRAP
jgi:hypothetical protein